MATTSSALLDSTMVMVSEITNATMPHGMNNSGMGHNGHGSHNTGMGPTTDMDHSGMHNNSGMNHGPQGHSSSEHSMQMYFHTGYKEYILFQDLLTKSEGALIAACAVIFLLSVLYEGLKTWREYLLTKHNRSVKSRPGKYAVEDCGDSTIVSRHRSSMCSVAHLLQTVLHIVQVTLSYCLMLVFMTFNVWLCASLVLGAGVGYFLFGWTRTLAVDATEHCH